MYYILLIEGYESLVQKQYLFAIEGQVSISTYPATEVHVSLAMPCEVDSAW